MAKGVVSCVYSGLSNTTIITGSQTLFKLPYYYLFSQGHNFRDFFEKKVPSKTSEWNFIPCCTEPWASKGKINKRNWSENILGIGLPLAQILCTQRQYNVVLCRERSCCRFFLNGQEKQKWDYPDPNI